MASGAPINTAQEDLSKAQNAYDMAYDKLKGDLDINKLKAIKTMYDNVLKKIEDELGINPRDCAYLLSYLQCTTVMGLGLIDDNGQSGTGGDAVGDSTVGDIDVTSADGDFSKQGVDSDKAGTTDGTELPPYVASSSQANGNAARSGQAVNQTNPSKALRANSALTLFYADTSRNVRYSQLTPDKTEWPAYLNYNSLCYDHPVVIAPSSDPSRLEVFVCDPNYVLHRGTYNFSTGSWGPLRSSGQTGLHYACVSPVGDSRIFVFFIISNNIYCGIAVDNNRWCPTWRNMGTLTSPHSTTAVSQGPGLIDLFVISGENLYWKSYSNMRWTPNWFQLGGNCPGKPAVVSWGTDRLDLFIRKNDGKLGHKSWDGKSWHPSELDFNYLDGLYDANPVAVSRGPGSIDLFIVAKDGELHHKRMENGRWLRAKGFDPLGGNFDQSFTPTATVCGDRLDIMLLGDEAETGREHYHKWWNGRWGPSLRGYDSMGEWGASTRISAVASQNIPRPTS